MKKCPFLKGEYRNEKGLRISEFQYCEAEDCKAYDSEHDTCKLIENKKFNFIN